jgi:hypothetical protein
MHPPVTKITPLSAMNLAGIRVQGKWKVIGSTLGIIVPNFSIVSWEMFRAARDYIPSVAHFES